MVSLGDLYLLDEAGEPFKRVQASDALDLPLVTGVEREDYVAHHDETVQRLTAALIVAQSYSSSPTGKPARLSEVHLDDEGVTLVTGDGQEVRLGEGDTAAKLARLARVRQELKSRALSAEVIRLDNRARPSSVTVSLHQQVSTVSSERGLRPGK
jgi:cell division protein FtsQ